MYIKPQVFGSQISEAASKLLFELNEAIKQPRRPPLEAIIDTFSTTYLDVFEILGSWVTDFRNRSLIAFLLYGGHEMASTTSKWRPKSISFVIV